jgi:hypothetical protein
MRIVLRCVFAILLSLWSRLSDAATHPVSPNEDFSNSTLQIHATASDGWHGIARTASSIAFGRNGASGTETFVAAVILFHIPEFSDSDAFTQYVREGVARDSPADRFEPIESSVHYSIERSYPCVRYHAVSMERKVHIAPFFRKDLRIENVALYCRHPDKPGLGFAVSYSHRGGRGDYDIDEEAESFIDSVQVIPPTKQP